MPPKRKGAKKAGDKGKSKQRKQDGQKAVSHDIEVPIDEGFKEDGKFDVEPDLSSPVEVV